MLIVQGKVSRSLLIVCKYLEVYTDWQALHILDYKETLFQISNSLFITFKVELICLALHKDAKEQYDVAYGMKN